MRNQSGFTFIELVMVVVITGILSVGLTEFIGLSVKGYVASADRAEVATTLVIATEKLARGVRRALPNSIRVGGDAISGDNCIEVIPVLVATRYLSAPIGGSGSAISALAHGGSTISARAVVYPIETSDLYTPTDASASSITSALASFPTGSNTITVSLGAAHEFRAGSPSERVYGAGTPIAWCQPAGSDRIYQYSGYGFNAAPVLPPVGGSREVLVTGLDDTALIAFDYTGATRSRNAVVTWQVAALAGEQSMSLGHEVQVRNVP